MKNKNKASEVNVAQSVTRAKSKIKSQKRKPKGSAIRVRRVNAVKPNMASSIASQLGYDNLAQDLTSQPKTVVADFAKTESGKTISLNGLLKLMADSGRDVDNSQYELPENVADVFQNTYENSEESDGDATAGLAAWLITRSALQKVQQFENLVADATKEYWQAKRKLLLVNKILASAYKSLEAEDVENIKLPSKEEIHSVITDTLANELFPSNSSLNSNGRSNFPALGITRPSANPNVQSIKRQIFKRSIPS